MFLLKHYVMLKWFVCKSWPTFH